MRPAPGVQLPATGPFHALPPDRLTVPDLRRCQMEKFVETLSKMNESDESVVTLTAVCALNAARAACFLLLPRLALSPSRSPTLAPTYSLTRSLAHSPFVLPSLSCCILAPTDLRVPKHGGWHTALQRGRRGPSRCRGPTAS